MNIDEIRNGVVIDHIKAGRGMDIYKFLELDSADCPVALIKNAASMRMGKKDIIKVDTTGSKISLDLSVLGYIDPEITVNEISDGVIVNKYRPELPREIVNIVKCKNPRCITSTEQELPHIFKLTDMKNHTYRCAYCESKAKAKR